MKSFTHHFDGCDERLFHHIVKNEFLNNERQGNICCEYIHPRAARHHHRDYISSS
jgi:hypothetical protein